MAKSGKRITKAREGIDREKLYALDDALNLLKERATAKFDETIEIALNLGVDPRHADQMVRGVVTLPAGTGKDVRVAVFAKGDKAEEAFRQSMLASQGGLGVFFSNPLVSTIMALGLIALFWPLIQNALTRIKASPTPAL